MKLRRYILKKATAKQTHQKESNYSKLLISNEMRE